MKRIIGLFTLLLLMNYAVSAQAPGLFNYQGVARNSVGNVLQNKMITLRLSIRDLTPAGAIVYGETRAVETNSFGLFNIQVGSPGATNVTGTIPNVNWNTGAKFIQVEIDPNGGNAFINIGTSQLASVPYALSAGSSNPVGPAGGSLTGNYPNPTIANGAVTQVMIAPGVTLPPSGAAGGSLTGNYPNPTIANGAVTQVMIAPGVTLPPNGAAGGSLTGNYPNPTIANGAVTQVMLAPGVTAIPTGNAGGDLNGTYPNPTVDGLQGRTVANTVPLNGQALIWNNVSNSWEPGIPAGSGTLNGTVNTIVKFTGANTGGNSQFTDDGTSTGLNTPVLSPNIKFHVTAGAIGNTIRGTLTGTPGTSIATSGSIYGESTTGIGVIGVSGTQNGVYGISTGTLGGTVGVSTGTGNGIWGVATGAGVAGYFDGGITGRGIIVTTGPSGIGTTSPGGRLEVIQPAVSVEKIDTFPALYGYSYTGKGSLRGGVSGAYNGSNYGTGVHGLGYNGIRFENVNDEFTTGNQDLGVFGSGNTAGVEGVSINGIGVVGYNRNGSFAATTGGGNSYGVYGYANTIGGATAPAIRYGVYGYATGAATNYAGYFSGNVQITGNIAKGGGTFKIDHPQDPENKYLYHSFIESPDMMNIYNGNTTTGADGFATVTMPSYFEALNKDFRYQLTVIGTFAQAIISREMSDGKFVIQTNQPNVKVSWQVTGVRNDKYANAHRVIPEVEKEAEFKGYYLHAAEWNQPLSKSIDALTRPKDPSTIKVDKPVNNPSPTKQVEKKPGVAGVEISVASTEK